MFPNPRRARIVLQAGFLLLLGSSVLHGGCASPKTATPAPIDPRTSEAPPSTAYSGLASPGSGAVGRTAAAAGSSEIVPAERRYDWGSHCGIPAGIPARTKIYASFSPGATAASINAAIAACPSGQVISLAAGIYSVSGLTMKSGVTVRGAGAGQTIINAGTGYGFSSPEAMFSFTTSGKEAIANGAWLAKGSTSVTMATTPGSQFAVGRLILIDQEDDNSLVFHRTGNYAGTRNLRHVSRITGISGKTLTFASPLPYTFVHAQNPMAQAVASTDSFGLEDLTVNAASCVRLTATDRCWVKNCELSAFENEAVLIRYSHQVEIRRCFIHEAAGFPKQSDGYGILAQYAVSCCRFEDNIGTRISYMFMMNGNDSSAFLYNYALFMARAGYPWQNPAFNCNHGPHSLMNLWEGNVGERWQNDGYHGSASHQTLFRNHIHGVNPAYTLDRRIMDFCRASYFFSAVGNVIGDPSWKPAYYEASKTQGAGYWNSTLDRSAGYIWVLGYPNMGGAGLTEAVPLEDFTPPDGTYPDSKVAATLFRHANFDYYNKATVFQDGMSQALPPSLYYASKPSYFGSLQWPPIGPDVPGLVTDIPARARWASYQNSGRLEDLFK
ncbi:MAG TPA: hypothetical protein VLJ16_01020 [Acidobacteriota bacterium]|nr:hypothetical protein [Acidobacteriota bacterium]